MAVARERRRRVMLPRCDLRRDFRARMFMLSGAAMLLL